MEALVKSCNVCWVWSDMPRQAQRSPKLQISNIPGKGGAILSICCM